jgi:hypothetical protein
MVVLNSLLVMLLAAGALYHLSAHVAERVVIPRLGLPLV